MHVCVAACHLSTARDGWHLQLAFIPATLKGEMEYFLNVKIVTFAAVITSMATGVVDHRSWPYRVLSPKYLVSTTTRTLYMSFHDNRMDATVKIPLYNIKKASTTPEVVRCHCRGDCPARCQA
jgi:hypothetical protein